MEYKHLGRSGLKVSQFCLGTVNFGDVSSPEESRAILNRALEEGINFVDTANRYGRPKGEGVTETIIGEWLAKDPSRRRRIVLATKVYNPMGSGPNERGLSAYHIRQACEDSLRRLQTDHIDLYQMHHVDRDTPWEEVWQAMEQLVQAGKVLYVGSSNFAAWHIAQAQCAADERNFMGLVSEQSLYNLSVRSVELEVIPACRAYGLGLLPWSPLNRGLLAGGVRGAEVGRRAWDKTQRAFEKHHAQLEAYVALCDELGEHPAHVALAWLLHNPAVTAPIVGPRTVDQFESNLRALAIRLPDHVLTQLDKIWPGPGGEAPEAYAW